MNSALISRRDASRSALAIALALALAACSPSQPESGAAAPGATPAAAPEAAPAATAAPVAGVLAEAPLEVGRTEIKTCNIEAIDGKHWESAPLPVAAGASFLLGGFLFDEPKQSVPATLTMRLVSQDQKHAWETPVLDKLDRPGLPEFLKVGDWALRSGFQQQVQLGSLPQGRYHLEVSFERDGERFVCDNGRDIEVVAPAAQ